MSAVRQARNVCVKVRSGRCLAAWRRGCCFLFTGAAVWGEATKYLLTFFCSKFQHGSPQRPPMLRRQLSKYELTVDNLA